MRTYLCVDFGSTFTKALLIDGDGGEVLAATSSRTTIGTDLMDGFDACLAALRTDHPVVDEAAVLACSSAGGGLRIAVVGQEELVTAEAGRRVALSSGGIVVGVLAHPHAPGAWDALAAEGRPDVVLLVGGTDGGNAAPLRASATTLAAGAWRGPVVVAGNVDVRDEIRATLTDAGLPVVPADNVIPRIGDLVPDSARAAVREVFLEHVIGGKALSARDGFRAMVRGATPDVVLTGVEFLAGTAGLPHGVAVVDVGGATTDVHSVVRLDAETAELRRDVVAVTPVTRTVEGDLGMRWSAASTARAAVVAGLAPQSLLAAGEARTADPGLLPEGDVEEEYDRSLASAASVLAVRRHAGRSRVVVSPEGRVIERTGKNLREVDLLIGSGGIFRNLAPAEAIDVLASATGPTTEGWQQPRRPRLAIDRQHVLPAIGLLAEAEPAAAALLARTLLADG